MVGSEVFGSVTPSLYVLSALGPIASNLHKQVRNLGVVFDSELKFDK